MMLLVNLLLLSSSIIFLTILVRFFLHRTALIYVVRRWLDWLDELIHPHQYFKVAEFNESTQQQNQFYCRVSLYINSLPSLEDSDYTNLFSGKNPNDIVLSPGTDQVIRDTFLGARVSWVHKITTTSNNNNNNNNDDDISRSLVLRIKRKDKRRILKPYLQHIHTVSDDIEQRGKELRIFTNRRNGKWKSVPFDHPSTFESLVLDPDLKTKVKCELEVFLKSKQYYHRLGRVWKRSYLLYGPSGTGKSSFIASVANFLNYDVYNVNLSSVVDDADLDALLLQTSSQSLIVVEDLDLYVSGKQRTVSSSGLMNFMDGLLNFQDERIMIFTMNVKDGVDSSLLRPGRIDVHIYFPMCDFNSFKCLATNYLGVKEHKLFPQVEEMFMSGATMSPAEISELMLVNRSSPSRALKSVISALQSSPGAARILVNHHHHSNNNNSKVVPRLSDSAAASPAPSSVAEDAAWKEAVPKEFRKLYGLLRMKSCRKPGSFDHDSGVIQR